MHHFTIRPILFIFLLVIVSCDNKSDEKLIRETYAVYQFAILKDKADLAAGCVDSTTLKYYNDMLDLIVNADSTKIESLSTWDKLMVFSIRQQASKNEILGMNGQGLLVYAIKHGLAGVGKKSVAGYSIVHVSITHNFATGQVHLDHKNALYSYQFRKEQGRWKIDLTSLFPILVPLYEDVVKKSGLSTNEYLFQALELTTGKRPEKEVWRPIK